METNEEKGSLRGSVSPENILSPSSHGQSPVNGIENPSKTSTSSHSNAPARVSVHFDPQMILYARNSLSPSTKEPPKPPEGVAKEEKGVETVTTSDHNSPKSKTSAPIRNPPSMSHRTTDTFSFETTEKQDGAKKTAPQTTDAPSPTGRGANVLSTTTPVAPLDPGALVTRSSPVEVLNSNGMKITVTAHLLPSPEKSAPENALTTTLKSIIASPEQQKKLEPGGEQQITTGEGHKPAERSKSSFGKRFFCCGSGSFTREPVPSRSEEKMPMTKETNEEIQSQCSKNNEMSEKCRTIPSFISLSGVGFRRTLEGEVSEGSRSSIGSRKAELLSGEAGGLLPSSSGSVGRMRDTVMVSTDKAGKGKSYYSGRRERGKRGDLEDGKYSYGSTFRSMQEKEGTDNEDPQSFFRSTLRSDTLSDTLRRKDRNGKGGEVQQTNEPVDSNLSKHQLPSMLSVLSSAPISPNRGPSVSPAKLVSRQRLPFYKRVAAIFSCGSKPAVAERETPSQSYQYITFAPPASLVTERESVSVEGGKDKINRGRNSSISSVASSVPFSRRPSRSGTHPLRVPSHLPSFATQSEASGRADWLQRTGSALSGRPAGSEMTSGLIPSMKISIHPNSERLTFIAFPSSFSSKVSSLPPGNSLNLNPHRFPSLQSTGLRGWVLEPWGEDGEGIILRRMSRKETEVPRSFNERCPDNINEKDFELFVKRRAEDNSEFLRTVTNNANSSKDNWTADSTGAVEEEDPVSEVPENPNHALFPSSSLFYCPQCGYYPRRSYSDSALLLHSLNSVQVIPKPSEPNRSWKYKWESKHRCFSASVVDSTESESCRPCHSSPSLPVASASVENGTKEKKHYSRGSSAFSPPLERLSSISPRMVKIVKTDGTSMSFSSADEKSPQSFRSRERKRKGKEAKNEEEQKDATDDAVASLDPRSTTDPPFSSSVPTSVTPDTTTRLAPTYPSPFSRAKACASNPAALVTFTPQKSVFVSGKISRDTFSPSLSVSVFSPSSTPSALRRSLISSKNLNSNLVQSSPNTEFLPPVEVLPIEALEEAESRKSWKNRKPSSHSKCFGFSTSTSAPISPTSNQSTRTSSLVSRKTPPQLHIIRLLSIHSSKDSESTVDEEIPYTKRMIEKRLATFTPNSSAPGSPLRSSPISSHPPPAEAREPSHRDAAVQVGSAFRADSVLLTRSVKEKNDKSKQESPEGNCEELAERKNPVNPTTEKTEIPPSGPTFNPSHPLLHSPSRSIHSNQESFSTKEKNEQQPNEIDMEQEISSLKARTPPSAEIFSRTSTAITPTLEHRLSNHYSAQNHPLPVLSLSTKDSNKVEEKVGTAVVSPLSMAPTRSGGSSGTSRSASHTPLFLAAVREPYAESLSTGIGGDTPPDVRKLSDVFFHRKSKSPSAPQDPYVDIDEYAPTISPLTSHSDLIFSGEKKTFSPFPFDAWPLPDSKVTLRHAKGGGDNPNSLLATSNRTPM